MTNGHNLLGYLLQTNLTWFINDKHQAKFGLNYTFHTFTPGILTGQAGSIILDQEINKQYAHELAVYAMDEWRINQRFTLNAGLRAVFYDMVGPYTKKQYNDDNLPTGVETSWKTNESIAFYPRFEPRAALNYLVDEKSSLKASFTQTYQFIHLATTSGASFPVDLWVPSSQRVKPQLAYQYALGYFRNFDNNKWETSAEVYYKPMYNQIEFKPFSRLFLNQNLEEEMVLVKA